MGVLHVIISLAAKKARNHCLFVSRHHVVSCCAGTEPKPHCGVEQKESPLASASILNAAVIAVHTSEGLRGIAQGRHLLRGGICLRRVRWFQLLAENNTMTAASPHNARLEFNQSKPLTLGVEIELQLIDPVGFGLLPKAETLLEAGRHISGLKSEFYRHTVELCTPVCEDAHEAEASLRMDVPEVIRIAAGLDIGLASTGSHPFARYADSQISRSERYDELVERHQWLSRRMTVFGLHVHVGAGSGEDCIRLHNGFLRYLPHLMALTSSSPFWQGMDTGLASCRPTTYESLPTAGHPYRLRDWREFEELHATLKRSGSIRSHKDLWWDMRPSPSYGTLELRMCDCTATLAETVAVTALVHVLGHDIFDRVRHAGIVVPPPRWMVRDNKWRVMRHGLDADLIVDGRGETRPLRHELRSLLRALSLRFTELGYERHLDLLLRIIERGTSADRQRRVFNRRGDISEVVKFNVAEFCAGTPKWDRASTHVDPIAAHDADVAAG
jgi:carboxylate-amine ligase